MSKKPPHDEHAATAFSDDLECVVADPLRFKRKLRIGEDAYAALRVKNRVQDLWEAGGMAMAGAGVASSPIVAGSFFASSGGLLSVIGLGTAVTPIGWVAAAAVATGGAYYGVTRMFRRQVGGMVDVVPKFINTPIDLLGMQLFDLIGALAFRLAAIDGEVAASERRSIERHFVDEWGLDPHYVERAGDVLAVGANDKRVKEIAKALSEFQIASPDCNAQAMQDELMAFLREVVEADGVIDEREELAIDAITAVFKQQKSAALKKLGRSVVDIGAQTGTAVSALTRRVGKSKPPREPA